MHSECLARYASGAECVEHRERSGGNAAGCTERWESRSFRLGHAAAPTDDEIRRRGVACTASVPRPSLVNQRVAREAPVRVLQMHLVINSKTPHLARGAGGAFISLPVGMAVALYGVRPRISAPVPVFSIAVCCFESHEPLSLRRGNGRRPTSTPRARAVQLAPN